VRLMKARKGQFIDKANEGSEIDVGGGGADIDKRLEKYK